MNSKSKPSTLSAPERIMETAMDLFYKQGYRATGVNEVIKDSGVAKATFYSHFPSKDDLCLAYLQNLGEGERAFIDRAIAEAETVLDEFLAPIQSLQAWLIDTDFRGCGFLNMAAEVPDHNSPLRKEGTKLYDDIRARVQPLCSKLIASDPKRYGHLQADALCRDYMLIFAGTIMFAELYHDIWPVHHALENIRRLIGKAHE